MHQRVPPGGAAVHEGSERRTGVVGCSLQLLHVSGQLLPPEDDGQPHGPGRPAGGAAWEPAARSVDAAHPGVHRPVGVLLHRAAEVFDPKVVATPSGPATEPLDAHAVDGLDRHLEF